MTTAWAIAARGTGKPPGFRAIKDDWPLAADETFIVTDDPAGLVLAEDGASLRAATPAELDPPPRAITRLQLRRQLRVVGYAAVKTALETAAPDLLDQWEAAQVIERDGDFIAFLKTTLNRTDAQIDAFFRLAATL